MCFHIHPKYPEPKLAETDIICYKVVRKRSFTNEFYSIYEMFRYKLKEIYSRTSFGIVKTFYEDVIYEGFHSYSILDKAIDQYAGHHGCIIKCIIPEGTIYYYNPEDSEYVSLQIIPIKRISKISIFFKLLQDL